MLPTQARGEAITPDMAYIHATPQGFALYFTCSASQCSYVGCVASNDSFRLHRHRLRNRSCCKHDESFRPPSHRRIEFDTSRVGPNPAQVIQPSSLLTLSMAFGRRSGHTPRACVHFAVTLFFFSTMERRTASFRFTLNKTCSGPGTPSCHAKFAALDSGHFSQFSCKQLVIGFLFLGDSKAAHPSNRLSSVINAAYLGIACRSDLGVSSSHSNIPAGAIPGSPQAPAGTCHDVPCHRAPK